MATELKDVEGCGMEFDAVNILIAFVFGTFGLIYFRYGQKQAKIPLIIIGIILMVYPYFVSSRWWLIGLGTVLTIIPKFI